MRLKINYTEIIKIKFILIAVTIVSNLCPAQTYSQLNISDTISIKSKIFETERKIIVTRSLKIKKENRNSCILYTDADDRDINGIILQSANNLIASKEMPQSYLVGIMHQDRNTELVEKEKLYRFITDEVFPFLEKEYPIENKVTIAGHSFGAYFATYAFFKNNNLFNSCIAISPAYWPNNKDLLSLIEEKKNSVLGNFFMAIGDKRWDEISLRDNTIIASKLLSDSKSLRFNFADLSGFSHNATPTVGFGLGFNYIFDEWEWGNILNEQDRRLKAEPDFWGFMEIKADALFHLGRSSEANTTYQESLYNVKKDNELSNKKRTEIIKRLKQKIRKIDTIP